MLTKKISSVVNRCMKYSFHKIFLTKMAKSSFEYVKNFEQDDALLPNTWIVVRLDGKCFHKFSDDHNFEKPNDIRALRLMNYAAFSVLKDFNEICIAFGQSDEYSFILKKNSTLYKRRAAKLLTTINSKFSSSYVFYWAKFFGKEPMQYPPAFDGRIVLYPSNENLIDYLKWRQADVHINNLYNTTFWTLILRGQLNPVEAEKRLCGTVSADKNEILFKEFNINYNNEPEIFKRGTILLRQIVSEDTSDKSVAAVVDIHDDMLKAKFWQRHCDLLEPRSKKLLSYDGPITDMIREQIQIKENTI
ncbi:probable tRNA(His) guanylyltransferase [Zerene cesonia]|uniref:probable tRNA(His) guanylyltransferase n=1 Tax=Zerene cesonia TaxID=33412 RepID=UPI0018E50ECC|nr:probable tRNA(His) guanylyltransferase [Zerene cesonia]